MRAVIQRVSHCDVTINGNERGSIQRGLLIFLGIEDNDSHEDIDWLAGKIARLRVFADDKGLMNLSVQDISGEIMVVSQFTLHASTKKGNRPSYIRASKPDVAIPLYKEFIQTMEKEMGKKIVTGEFAANMQINLNNDGPVTIIIDTKNKE